MTLVAFLQARLADAEHAIPWSAEAWVREGRWVISAESANVVVYVASDEALGEYIASHNPARELAKVEALWKLIDLHSSCGGGIGHCDDGGHGWIDIPGGGCTTLGLLALQFSSHPAYQQDWRI